MASNKENLDQPVNNDNKQNGGQLNTNTDLITLTQTKTRGRPRKSTLSSKNNSAVNSAANSRSYSKDRDETWTCDTCDDVFQSDQSKLLECEYCNTHRCIKCLNLPVSCYKGLSWSQDFPWFCNNCLVKTLTCLKEAKCIEEKCSEFMKEFEEKNQH